jgi:hypothetical protein
MLREVNLLLGNFGSAEFEIFGSILGEFWFESI